MCINNTSHLIYPIKRSNNRKLFIGNTKFTLGRTQIANFNSAKTFKIANSQTLISANIFSFTVVVATSKKRCCHLQKKCAPPLEGNDHLGADHLIRGGGVWFFLRDQTFFLTPSLNVQFFSDLIKSKQFFS